MNVLRLALVLFLLLNYTTRGQELKTCATTEVYKEAVKKHPEILMQQQELEQFTARYEQEHRNQRSGGGIAYVIPVVFHIVHNYGPENISDEQVYDAIRVLNEDYSKQNADTTMIVPSFLGIAGNSQIEFRLANKDPQGNCTNGIDRVVSPLTMSADDGAKLNPWPYQNYLNIWVINSFAGPMAGAAAYAYYPGTAFPTNVDGIISLYSYVGSIGASTLNRSRVLTHEVGHYLNLAHVWGSTNQPGVACGDDGVSDTPETKGWVSCSLNGAVCNPPIVENVQNYMEYSYCGVMFTQGQKTRMHAALNSSAGSRSSLWTQGNLTATGTDGFSAQVCIPNTDFTADENTICTGATVNFHDLCWNGDPTAWSWDFPGGTPSTSTDSFPAVVYNTAGTYDVTLTASNSTGSSSFTRTAYVRVSGTPSQSIPFSESFEVPASFPGTDGYILNPDNGATWTRVTTAASSGTSSIRMNNYSNSSGQIDKWFMPPMDFSNVTQPTMTFKVANAQRNSSSGDELRIAGSMNCGHTWNYRFSKSGAVLSTAGIVSTAFTPNSSQWRLEPVTLNPFALKPNVRLMFENISDGGNNTYIDEININGTLVGVDEVEDIQLGFALYPNPAAGHTTVQFLLTKNQHVQVDVTDITGHLVSSVLNGDLNSGLHEYKISINSPGIYFVDLVSGGRRHVRKLIISG
ncbi:MAG TPA: M43 family zinc metalloprotease [Bacteroidia bacterium]|nr:M43 family zinc metalloprotease [Bacteroidia bacterium]